MTIRPEALTRTRQIAGSAAALALLAGATGLSGWILDSALLKTGFAGEVSMKANTAVGLCWVAAAVGCLLPSQRAAIQVTVARTLGVLVALLGALTLSQHVFGANLGIDELLFAEPRGEAATASPGRMGPPACVSFVLLGAGVFAFDARTRRGTAPAQWCALGTSVLALFAILGYATGAEQLYGIARYTGIAVHTAVAFVLLALALFLGRAELQPARLLVADNPGGHVARTMLPAAILLPLVIGWLRTIGQRKGLYDTAFGRALLLLTLIVLFTAIVWRVAHRLSSVAAERAAAEQASSRARAEAERLALENVATLSVLESLLAHAPIGLAFFDRDGRCVRVNPFLAGVHLAPQAPRAGQPMQDVLPGITVELEAAMERLFRDGTSTMDMEIVSRAGSTSEQSWLLGVFPVRDASGSITLAGAVLIEITERKRLEAQRGALLQSERAARVEAERAARLKDEFLATLSHELRTPLNAILGWTAIAKQTHPHTPELDRPLQTIERNARLQAQLIEDLLDISRIVSGQMRLAVEAVQVPLVVRAAVTSMMPAANAKQITLDVDIEPDLVPITGDSARLQQVVWNLVSNAVKFTPPGGRVQVSVKRSGTWVELTVRDDGAGITPEFLPHVFDRFRQADSSTTRRHGGLGLGLSIVKQLVELHGGSVTVTSAGENQGATFVMLLPVRAEHEQYAELKANREPLPPAVLAGVHVLVVDDESDAGEIVSRVLVESSATVTLATSVEEAVAALEREPAQVLVSDIAMPGRDGYDLIHAVRQRHDAKALPAIAVTAFARAEDRIRALSAGFQLHITKPIDPHELTYAIASLAGRTGT